MADTSRAVLITGCSTGIGHASARWLQERGWPVWATVHSLHDVADLASTGCHVRVLDLYDEATMHAVVREIEAEHGAVGVLVNNAGWGLEAPVEEIPLDEMRRQFEVNLFGPVRLTQLVLPGMRRQGRGRIVNVTSVGGRITIPGGAAYHASKHGLESLSDALRFEVAGFGIDVIVVEPGAIASQWVPHAVAHMADRRSAGGPYADLYAAMERQLVGAHEGLLARTAGTPEDAAHVIERAISARRPRTRYAVPGVTRLFMGGRFLPGRAWDFFLRRMYPTPVATADGTRERGPT